MYNLLEAVPIGRRNLPRKRGCVGAHRLVLTGDSAQTTLPASFLPYRRLHNNYAVNARIALLATIGTPVFHHLLRRKPIPVQSEFTCRATFLGVHGNSAQSGDMCARAGNGNAPGEPLVAAEALRKGEHLFNRVRAHG